MNVESKNVVFPAYAISASFYDDLVGIYAFEQWRENFERLEKGFGLDISCCADVACGTGLASRYLAGRGAEVYAFDLSREMLGVAAANTGGKVRLLRQDMRYLLPQRKVNMIICATDSLNHILHEEDIRRTFRSFYAALKPRGFLCVDMNTAWQLREGGDNKPWDFCLEGMPLRWVSRWRESEQTATLRFIFPETTAGGGEPCEEIHRERAYPVDWVLEELNKAGFAEVEVLDAAGLGKIKHYTRRLQFIVRR